MAKVEQLKGFLEVADRLISFATKEEVAEALRLVAMNVAHYQAKYGELPLDEVLEIAYTNEPNQSQLQLTADGMEIMVGVLGGIVQGFEPQPSH